MSGFFTRKLAGYLPENLEEKEAAQGRIARIKTVSEFLSDLVDAIKDTDLPGAIAQVSPWAEAFGSAVADTVPPIRFVVKLFENLGRIDDAPTLGYLACCLAYQRALEQTLAQEPELQEIGKIKVRKDLALKENAETYDFASFSLGRALQHPFVQDADRSLRRVLVDGLGLEKDVAGRLVIQVRTYFVSELITILSDRDTSQRFEPFYRFLQLRPAALDAYADLRSHAEYQRRLFEQQPVLGVESFALQHVYVDLDCGDLAWGDIDRERVSRNEGPIDPFDETHGGRQSVLKTVLRYVADPDFKEAIVIQGPAGAGKSTFTIRLCCALADRGLRPVRVELKNLSTRQTKDPWQALPEAVELDDKRRGSAELFLDNRIFEERLPFRFGERETNICPYVLILDGWDEISSSASQGYQQELDRLLAAVRDELFRRTDGMVRVILAGRPTGVVGQSVLVGPKTRILTLRDMQPEQLGELIERFQSATSRRPLPGFDTEPWNLEQAGEVLASIRKRYAKEHGERPKYSGVGQSSPLEVLGLPLLAYMTLRLVAENPDAAQNVVDDTTALYRSLVDLVIQKAGKPSYGRPRGKGEPVITGSDLRRLLQDTAAAMTALDVRNISREELKIRLGRTVEQLEHAVRALGEEQVLGRLLISFFFKGGHPELGCEFSHKSFREYLFAEKIVERLKNYGRQSRTNLPPRVSEDEPYWKDFSPGVQGDGRYELSRDLLEHLGPQWLQLEEIVHLQGLLAWEISRAKRAAPEPQLGQATEPLRIEDWCAVRDGLADLWDWWGEGVHLRALPQMHRRGIGIEYQKPLAVEHAEDAIWRSRHDTVQAPIRVITLDGHLGDALFVLCSVVHAQIIDPPDRPTTLDSERSFVGRYQTQRQGSKDIRFAPSGKDYNQFLIYIARINACGFRPLGSFPILLTGEATDFHRVHFLSSTLSSAFLPSSILSGALLYKATLSSAYLHRAFLSRAMLREANLSRAILTYANLSGTHLSKASLSDTDLSGANLSGANLSGADLSGADLFGADLSGADLSGADLSEANLSAAVGKNLAILLKKARGLPSHLPDGTRTESAAKLRAWLKRTIAAETSDE